MPVEAHLAAFADAFTTPGPTFGNATESALIAGYARAGKRETARTMGCRLLKKPAVQKLIAERLAGAGITSDALRLRVGGIAFGEPGKKWTGSDILRACDLLAKMVPGAIAPTKAEVTGAGGAPISISINGIVRE